MTDKIQVYSARGTPSGGISTPASSTDNAAVRWDGTTGQALQDSALIISDLGVISGITANANIINTGTLTTTLIDNTPIGTTTPAAGYFSALREKIGGFFAIFTHANSADRTYTLPNFDGTLATLAGTETLSNKTLSSPTIVSFFNAQHGHQSAGDGATLLPGALQIPYVRVEDQKTKNTHAGASTNTTWHTRTLNTEVQDTNSKASVAANQVTLAAGTWDIRISAPAYAPSVHAIVLRNDTAGAILLFGWNEDASSADTSVTRAWASGRLTLAASQALSIRHYISVGVATFGLGVALNVNDPDAASRSEVYAVFEAWQAG